MSDLSRILLIILLLSGGIGGASSQTANDSPWDSPQAVIVIDPYAGNSIDWAKVATDKHVKAVIHKASEGLTADPAFLQRAEEARQYGLLWGAFHLGRLGDPIAQAELLLHLASQTGAKFLAIDIEEVNPKKYMSLDDAQIFMQHIFQRTGRYPAVYVNFGTYSTISKLYDKTSIFAKGPLWIARFKRTLGLNSKNVWDDYTLWQFSSEINCSAKIKCLYRVPGTASDMDVDVFHGDENALRVLFN